MKTSSLFNGRYMQFIVTIMATLALANVGMHSAWGSPALPKLSSEDSPLGVQLSSEEKSWIASGFALGYVFGSPITGLLLDKLGRKNTLLFGSLPLLVAWTTIAFATSPLFVIIARTLAGAGAAIVIMGNSVYLGEVIEKDIRGMMSTYIMVLKLFGTLYVFCAGPYVSYLALNLSCTIFSIFSLLIFCILPESPYYLVKIGKQDIARINVMRLSRRNATKEFIDERMSEIQMSVEYDMINRSTFKEFLSGKEYRKPLYIMIGIKTLQQFSGTNAINPYLQTIIETSESSISPELSSVICGFLQIPAVLLASFLVERMGRRPLLILSAIGCSITLFAEGLFFYLKLIVKADVTSIQWLPTIALGFYLISSPMGVLSLPFVLAGELFAINIKGHASSTIMIYSSTLGFIVSRSFGPISEAWGMYVMFWIFSGCCAMGVVFVFIFVPETKGKSFVEIQEELKRKQ